MAFNTVLTVSAGVQWYEAYHAVYAQGCDIVGGLATTGFVGAAGGWIGGGGHSILSPKYGLGWCFFEMIVPFSDTDGNFVTLNWCV